MRNLLLAASISAALSVGAVSLPQPSVKVLPQQYGWFDGFSVIWAENPAQPYSLEIIDEAGISLTKNLVEPIDDLSVYLVEYQETEDSPAYMDAQLVVTLPTLEYQVGSFYTLTIPAGAVNVFISDSESVPNEEVNFSFTLSDGESVTLPEPNISPLPGEVESLSEVEVSWTGALGTLNLLNQNDYYSPANNLPPVYFSVDGVFAGGLESRFEWSSRNAQTPGSAGDILVISLPTDIQKGKPIEITIQADYLQVTDVETGTLYNDEITFSYLLTNNSGNGGNDDTGGDDNTGSIQILKWGDVPVLPDSFSHWIGKDGILVVGEAPSAESSWGYDTKSGDIFYYEAASIGDGNSIAENGIVVGTDKVFMSGAFLLPNVDPMLIESLLPYSESFLDAITWDGTRFCGQLENPDRGSYDENDPEKQTMQYLPFYCDINGNEISEPVLLPTPERDFFNLVPQYCTAKWISDDGKTILGQVIDNSGYYIYPIVYHEDAEGVWSYDLPSAKLFNPDNLEVPVWPIPEMAAPQAQDFIGDEELREYFLELVEEWDGSEDSDPYQLLEPSEGEFSLMTPEEWEEYQDALMEYQWYNMNVYQPLVDKYYDDFSRFIAKSCNFLQTSMAMNPQGTLFSQTRVISRVASDGNPVTYHIPYLFTIGEEEPQIFGDEFSEMQITQILSDGTILAASPKPGATTPDATPQHSFVLPAGTSQFILLEDYLKQINSDYAAWMQSYLFKTIPIGYDEDGALVNIDLTVTGLVTVSDDFSTLAGGIQTDWWDLDENFYYYSYFLTNVKDPEASIKRPGIAGSFALPCAVYNLQGVKIADLKEGDSLSSLPKGLYIINGKKIIVGR